MQKLFLSLGINVVGIFFVVLIAGGLLGFAYLLDWPSLVIALVFPFLSSLVSFGPTQALRSYGSACNPRSTREELQTAQGFFQILLGNLGAFTLFAVVTGTILLLANLSGNGATLIGKSLAVALLSIFYASVGALLLVLPFMAQIKARLGSL